ncbi:MAG: endonuclease/exonuclease/phosphatase family protein [Chromatiaceae bacterium]|nr:endonuclease/exonuclease/phosphatase family protein [Chromatiaceae bacterium]MCF7994637.1 endonuclease/exonuclease/phosphatase family protein [Chromatiaceae bacterium]MCF8003432.1 endonuclease/exonuclease/phosphatase family protein [Chromatiaceae bacterium]MCF8015100.1 endonuclease/exonuclease/phosphatase family protein [Chromatiaceae bacterium]
MNSLRLLTFNIQAGIESRRYRDYFANSWKHLIPHAARQRNLASIGALLQGFDIIGLQEVDAGSLRSAYIDQAEYLAQEAGYPYWMSQVNRELGHLARHSNGLLSRIRPGAVTEHKLPGLPGRGAMVVEFPTNANEPFAVCVLHLALGRRAQRRQLDYLVDIARSYRMIVLMGDFNCGCGSRLLRASIAAAGLRGLDCELKTFPSWRPERNLDHILVSPHLRITAARVLDYALSDHLPISMEVELPDGVDLLAPEAGAVAALRSGLATEA